MSVATSRISHFDRMMMRRTPVERTMLLSTGHRRSHCYENAHVTGRYSSLLSMRQVCWEQQVLLSDARRFVSQPVRSGVTRGSN